MPADLHNLQTRKNIGTAKGLLHSLVPRAQSFCFYNINRECVWSSDGADDYEIDNFVADLPDEIVTGLSADDESIRRTLSSGRTLLLLIVRGDEKSSLGVLIVVFSRNAGKSSSFNPNLITQILTPAVDMIGESLLLSQRLQQVESQVEERT